MSPVEADELARRVANVWRETPSVREWVEELTPLDLERSRAAFNRLRKLEAIGMSIPRFLSEYRALDQRETVVARPDASGIGPWTYLERCREKGRPDEHFERVRQRSLTSPES